MPIYNCAATLDAAVQSILSQTFYEWELLLVDDGSTDGTTSLARSYSDPRIRFFEDGKHLGLVARLNQAIGLSRGRYFARMDGDDVSYPERLALQVDYLGRHPEVDLLGGSILIFGRDGKPLGTRASRLTHEEICRRPWSGFHLAHPTWVGGLQWFRAHLYRSEAIRCEDQDLLLRSHEVSRFAAIPEIVLGYREEKPSLGKLLRGRRSFVTSAFLEGSLKRKYWLGVSALVEHTIKALAECMAIGTGLGYRVLRHRAMPIGSSTEKRWMEIWRENREGSCERIAGNVQRSGIPTAIT